MDMSKFKSREDWIRHGTYGNSLGSFYGRRNRARRWDRQQGHQEVKRLAQELGIDVQNGYEIQRRFGQIVSINGVPIPPEKRKALSNVSVDGLFDDDDDDTDDWDL
jgi:hypothetical protein